MEGERKGGREEVREREKELGRRREYERREGGRALLETLDRTTHLAPGLSDVPIHQRPSPHMFAHTRFCF